MVVSLSSCMSVQNTNSIDLAMMVSLCSCMSVQNTNSLNLAMRNLYKNNGSAKTPPPSQTPGKQKSKKTPHGQRTPSSSVRDSENPATPVRWVVDRCGSGDASRNKEDMAMELASDQAVCPVHASDSAGVEDTVTSTAVCTSSTSSETYEKSNVADKAKLSVDKEDSVPSRSKKREKSGAVRTTSVMNGMEDGEQLGESPKKVSDDVVVVVVVCCQVF